MSGGGTEFLRPIARADYAREAEVEADIVRLLALAPAALAEAIKSTDFRMSGTPRMESLVYLLRECVWSDDKNQEKRYCKQLILRSTGRIRKLLQPVSWMGADALQEMEQEIVVRCIEVWQDTGEKQSFWEVRFFFALDRLVHSVMQHAAAERRRSIPLERVDDLAGAGNAPSESAAILDSLTIRQALAGMPAAARMAFVGVNLFGLTHTEIAHKMGVTDRTVRNYLSTAVAYLQRTCSSLE